MALCSYDNELNQRYNINKEIKMTPAQKKAQEAKRIEDERLAEEARVAEEAKVAEEAEAKRIEDERLAEENAGVVEDVTDMNILEAFKVAESDGKVARRGWSKELKKHFVAISRGETLPHLSNGKHASPYTPSIVDVMADDWFDFEEVGE